MKTRYMETKLKHHSLNISAITYLKMTLNDL